MKPFKLEAVRPGDCVQYQSTPHGIVWLDVRFIWLSRDLHPVIQLADGSLREVRCDELRMKPKTKEMWVQVMSNKFVTLCAGPTETPIEAINNASRHVHFTLIGEPQKIIVEVD